MKLVNPRYGRKSERLGYWWVAKGGAFYWWRVHVVLGRSRRTGLDSASCYLGLRPVFRRRHEVG